MYMIAVRLSADAIRSIAEYNNPAAYTYIATLCSFMKIPLMKEAVGFANG